MEITRLASSTTLWHLTCQQPGASLPNGLVFFKIRGLSAQMALDRLAARRPELQVLSVEREATAGRPVRLGEMMATERS